MTWWTKGKYGKGTIWAIGLVGAVALGAALRLVWVMDIEYKGDEAWTFDRTQQGGRTDAFPWVGMPSSLEVRNPGMSVWVFLLLSKLFMVKDPTGLARSVQVLNIFAIGLLILFAFRVVPKEEREPWLWAAALVSVNPLAVLLHRKIWPPSVLPVVTLLTLWGWWFRDRRWGALLWGLVGVSLGQIHISGFFFTAGLFAWAMVFDRKRVAWLSWLVGICVGGLPLIPWLDYAWREMGDRPIFRLKWIRWLEFRFWLRWITEPFGLSLKYSLEPQFSEFLAYPLINGQPTYLVSLIHVLIMGVGSVVLARGGFRLWRERHQWRDLLVGTESATAFTQNAALWGFGILLTASSLHIHRHYMIVTFPLMFVWLARLALGDSGHHSKTLKVGRTLLIGLCILEAVLSVSFLYYIHVNQGAIHGDYGVAYGAQHRARDLSP